MKKQIVVGIMLVLVIIGLSGCMEQTSETGEKHEEGFYTYENAEYGISIKYPDAWTKKENFVQNTIVTFLPRPNITNTLEGAFYVSVLDVGDMNESEFKQAHIEYLSTYLTNFNISYEGVSSLSNLSGYKIVFTFMQGISNYTQLETWAFHDNKLYMLTFTSNENSYDDYISNVQQMINSFKIEGFGG